MKCPFQTTVTHIPEHMEEGGIIKVYPKDVTSFGECLEDECPFYNFRWVKVPGQSQLVKYPDCRRNI